MTTPLDDMIYDAFRTTIHARDLHRLKALVVGDVTRHALNGSRYHEPPLRQAVSAGWEAGVDTLLAAGAEVNVSVCHHCIETPLHVAVINNNIKLAVVLLTHGANPNLKDGRTTAFQEALCVARPKVKMVQAFLQGGAHPNGLDHAGRTPLSRAVTELASIALVQTFIEAKVNPLEPDLDGHTPLSRWAARSNVNRVDHATMAALLQHAVDLHIERERAALNEAMVDAPLPMPMGARNRL